MNSPGAMTAKGGGASYGEFIARGWTDELLIEHGYMLPAASATAVAATLEELKAALDRALAQKVAAEQSGGPQFTEALKEFQRAHSAYWGAIGAPPETDVTPEQRPAVSYETLVDRTDQGNANLLVRLANGDLRYVAETKQWMRWDGERWRVDVHEEFVTTFALRVAKLYMDDAKQQKAVGRIDIAETQTKWATKCRNKAALDAMISLARKIPGVPISITELDRDPWLLGVENGVVDLRTGLLRETEAREDYVTKRCPVRFDPEAKAPRWERFITEITGTPVPAVRDTAGAVVPTSVGKFVPRPKLAEYIHRALGYSITGSTQEQKFFIGIGPGSNGKTIVFALMQDVAGPYATPLPPEFFIAVKHTQDAERPTSVAASLAGKRLVVTSETKEGQKLEVAVIKTHTGEEQILARGMRKDPIKFEISHKPWLLTNAAPSIDHLDLAMRGRLHVIPFDRRWNRPGETQRDPELPDGDKELKAYMRANEREGILAWLVRGAKLYYDMGLNPPAEVVAFTEEYIARQDHLGQWLTTQERCVPEQGTKASELFACFTTWCAAEGRTPNERTQTAFSLALRSKQIPKKDAAAGTLWGLRARLSATVHHEEATRVFGDMPAPLPPGVTLVPPPGVAP